MDQFKDIALPLILVFEGEKFTDHPADKGGPTRYGVTQKNYDLYRKSRKWAVQSVKDIGLNEVREIYFNNYWAPAKCSDLTNNLGICVFDTAVNSGCGRSTKLLQQIIGAKVDGVIGQETIKKLKEFNQETLVSRFLDSRVSFYNSLVGRDASQKVFLAGWLRRVRFLREFVLGNKTLGQIRKEW
jgi:lysozyme family protein